MTILHVLVMVGFRVYAVEQRHNSAQRSILNFVYLKLIVYWCLLCQLEEWSTLLHKRNLIHIFIFYRYGRNDS